MNDYEDFHDMNDPETSGLGGEAPENPAASPAPAETPVYTAPAQTPDAAPAEPFYELPEQRRGAYSDAGYIPASDAGAVPKSSRRMSASRSPSKPSSEDADPACQSSAVSSAVSSAAGCREAAVRNPIR